MYNTLFITMKYMQLIVTALVRCTLKLLFAAILVHAWICMDVDSFVGNLEEAV